MKKSLEEILLILIKILGTIAGIIVAIAVIGSLIFGEVFMYFVFGAYYLLFPIIILGIIYGIIRQKRIKKEKILLGN